MTIIYGTINRVSVTDFTQRCRCCRKVFFFDRDCHGKWVVCPYCKTKN